jgi:hypothetical protein
VSGGGGMTGESLVEAVDGPVAIAALVGKSTPVLTRLPGGGVGFRLMAGVDRRASGVPVVRVVLDNGQSLVAAPEHVLYVRGMAERPAGALAPGDLLESSFHFPAGYVFRRMDGTPEVSAGAVKVVAIEDAGSADVFGGAVRETRCYFTTAGVLCRE